MHAIPDQAPPPVESRAAWRALGLIALLCLLAWSDSFTGAFQFDDRFSITQNERVRDFDVVRILCENPTRALPELSFALNWFVSGENTWSYHVTNLELHTLAAWIVWWLALLVFQSRADARPRLAKLAPGLALLVGVVFALHPVQTQAVTYVSQRAAVMAALFYFLSVACYLRFRLRGGGGFYVAAIVSAVAAALSKPNAASLPGAILMVELLFARGNGRGVALWLKRLGWVAPLVIAPVLIAAFSAARGMRSTEALTSVGAGVTGLPSVADYALTQIDVVRTYWRLFVLPVGLNLDHDYAVSSGLFAWPTIASLALHVALVGAAIVLIARRRRIEGFGILWFYLALSVESSIIPLSDVIMEHRMYLAVAGPLIALGAAVGPTLMQRRFRVVLILIVVALLALTWRRNLVWYNGVSLWTDAARKSPAKKRPVYNAANALFKAGRYREAEPFYLSALELEPEGTVVPESEGLPVRPVALRELAHLYVRTGQTTEALATLPRAIAWNPEDGGLPNDLAVALMRVGRFADAVAPARKATELEPDEPTNHVNLGLALLRSGDTAAARSTLEHALALSADNVRALIYRSEVAQAMGNTAEARAHLTRAISAARAQGAPESIVGELRERLGRLDAPSH